MKHSLRVILAVAVACCSGGALPQAYPGKPIRIVSAFGVGNPADTSFRLVSQKMGESMGQPLVIDPNLVASGVGAGQVVMRAAPDGYTLLYALPSMLMIPPYLIKAKPFDPLKDFTPITSLMDGPIAIMVAPSFPPKNVKELIEYAKENPGKVAYGTNGIGGTYHLEMELFSQQFGIKVVQVPYKGTVDSVKGFLSGEIPMVYGPYGAVAPLVRAGKMRVLVVLDYKRYPDLPDVPAMGEEINNYQRIPTGLNLYGPAGLPAAIARRIHAEGVKALALPDIQGKLKELTFFGIGTSPEALAAQQIKDYEIIARAVKAAGLQPQ
jgi:tripartite-type tricarboxylate transporter receptor subunit TctC